MPPDEPLCVLLGVPPMETRGEPGLPPLRERGVEFGVLTLGERESEGRRRRSNSDWKRGSSDCAQGGAAIFQGRCASAWQRRGEERLRRSSDASASTSSASGSFSFSLGGGVLGGLGVMVASGATPDRGAGCFGTYLRPYGSV